MSQTSLIPDNHYAARKHTHETRGLLFVGTDSCLDERTGETFPRNELPTWIQRWSTDRIVDPPAIVCNDAPSILKELNDAIEHPRWTWRATPLRRVKRGAAKPPESKPAVSIRLQVHYCGFRRTNGHRRNQYLYFYDCSDLTGKPSTSLYPEMCEEGSLKTFGERYREFCRDNGIRLASSRGGFGGAMLRDPRFIGSSERRIPAFVNEAARANLPGNHYELRTEPNQRVNGVYLDITNAHHHAASQTLFPDPAGIRARGFHREPPTSVAGKEPWAKDSSRVYKTILRTHGLLLVRAEYRHISSREILHPDAQRATSNKTNLVWCYTNELDLLKKSGFTVTGIEAAFTAGRTSDSLNRYAEHAVKSLSVASKEDRQWMKSLFISTYGMLGKRPAKYQSVSNMGGTSFDWPTSKGWIEGQLRTVSQEHSPSTTNVIALGMIQAETRRNVIETARWLQSLGIRVLALYADSIIVEGDSQLPLLPPEWRVKRSLNNLMFYDKVSWVADEDMRLPGRAGGHIDRRARAIAQEEIDRNRKSSHSDLWTFMGETEAWRGPDRAMKHGAITLA